MKTFWSILGVIGFVVLAVFAYRKFLDWMGAKNPRDKEEVQANIQGDAKASQAAASYGSILPPSATFVRPNGALIDLNPLGGSIPPLYTLPRWSPVLAPNG